ncbi:small integral membrane protein 14 [Drosophila biarmipes]|uniref:small integral membrane protein 14 n=1 Tax=Drosophila biarmipes TaxID=125945 RepID=UPI0007E83184|nr:small integral membrane protein 14 [Drosophila biarmipes]XP_016947345.1 small integral membrane protein 14 [Drosophila biarmipes]XP_016947346.1 small integral membrane protein 14 [Drosophila biarmipes]XP_016947347.1 small integral membrane protein 14 [Drosophila biarmipes]XP_043947741.1 small integral membrane protein 14 [Drosophila biarmipes]XP_050743186.1 small integral membrane protein 14 [Drosophila biarmipes]
MSDDFDGCECVWSQEYAMQRLINFIRQNQNACTDTECFDVSGRTARQAPVAGRGDDSGFTVAMIFLIVAMFMYILNPSTWGNLTSNKPAGVRRDNQDGPPPPQPPPPAIN